VHPGKIMATPMPPSLKHLASPLLVYTKVKHSCHIYTWKRRSRTDRSPSLVARTALDGGLRRAAVTWN